MSEQQISPLGSRLWGRFLALQDRLAQEEPQHAEAIRGLEFKEIRERLGLPISWLVQQYQLTPTEVDLWESSGAPVPPPFGEDLVKLDLTTQAVVDNETDRLQRTPVGQRTVTVYATDAAYHRAHPEAAPLPASWHRAVYTRVAVNVDGLRLLQES